MVEFSKGGHCLSSKAIGESHLRVSGKLWEGKWFSSWKKYLERFWTVRIDWIKHVVNNTKVVGSIPILTIHLRVGLDPCVLLYRLRYIFFTQIFWKQLVISTVDRLIVISSLQIHQI